MELRAPVAPPPLTIEESARMVGAWAWAESHLYEVVGSWVPSTAWPGAKVWLASASQHHAWRAQVWYERLAGRLVPAYPGAGAGPFAGAGTLPTGGLQADVGRGTAGWAATGLVRPGRDGAEAALAFLGRLQGDAARLGGVLSRHPASYRCRLQVVAEALHGFL